MSHRARLRYESGRSIQRLLDCPSQALELQLLVGPSSVSWRCRRWVSSCRPNSRRPAEPIVPNLAIDWTNLPSSCSKSVAMTACRFLHRFDFRLSRGLQKWIIFGDLVKRKLSNSLKMTGDKAGAYKKRRLLMTSGPYSNPRVAISSKTTNVTNATSLKFHFLRE